MLRFRKQNLHYNMAKVNHFSSPWGGTSDFRYGSMYPVKSVTKIIGQIWGRPNSHESLVPNSHEKRICTWFG